MLGILFLTIVVAAWPIVDDPKEIDQRPLGRNRQAPSTPMTVVRGNLQIKQVLRRWDFWILVMAVGVITGGSSMKYAHLVPLIGEQGYSIEQASMLLALAGGAGAIGSLFSGVLADRFGGATVLIATAMLQSLMWFVFLIPLSLPLLTIDAIAIGMCGGGIAAAQCVFISQRFGSENFSRVLGVLAIALMPFFVGINPLAGHLRDLTGDYRLSIVLLIVASLVVSALLAFVIVDERKRKAATAAF